MIYHGEQNHLYLFGKSALHHLPIVLRSIQYNLCQPFIIINNMSRAKSLILSELALFNVAVTSVSDQEERHHRDAAGQQSSIPRRRYSSFNLNSTSDDNDPIVEVAKAFLVATCPDLLTILDAHYDQASARDRFIKIGRSVNATLREY